MNIPARAHHGPSILEWPLAPAVLRGDVFRDPASLARIAQSLADGRAVVVEDALDPAFAEDMYQTLDRCHDWIPCQSGDGNFHRKNHEFPEPEVALAPVDAALGSEAAKAFMTRLSGLDCSGDFTFRASRYVPGDYSLPHRDCSLGRQVAFVWNLSKNWSPSWGGSLYWCPGGEYVTPKFNTLVLFNVSLRSWHLVCPVSTFAEGKRLCVNGWWMRPVAEDEDPYALLKGSRESEPSVVRIV